MMRDLVPVNAGGAGRTPAAKPSAHMNSEGAFVLNSAADALIGGNKWRVRYEDDASRTPAIELAAAGNADTGAFAVTRSNVSRGGGGSAKVGLRSLRTAVSNFEEYIGAYRVQRIAQGLRLVREDEAIIL